MISNPKETAAISGVVTTVFAKYMGSALMTSSFMGLGVASTVGLGILYVYDEEQFNSIINTASGYATYLKNQSIDYGQPFIDEGLRMANEYPIPTANAMTYGVSVGAIAKFFGASTLSAVGTAGLGAVVSGGLAYLYFHDKDNFDYLVETSKSSFEKACEFGSQVLDSVTKNTIEFGSQAVDYVNDNPKVASGTGITMSIALYLMYLKYQMNHLLDGLKF